MFPKHLCWPSYLSSFILRRCCSQDRISNAAAFRISNSILCFDWKTFIGENKHFLEKSKTKFVRKNNISFVINLPLQSQKRTLVMEVWGNFFDVNWLPNQKFISTKISPVREKNIRDHLRITSACFCPSWVCKLAGPQTQDPSLLSLLFFNIGSIYKEQHLKVTSR